MYKPYIAFVTGSYATVIFSFDFTTFTKPTIKNTNPTIIPITSHANIPVVFCPDSEFGDTDS